MSFRYGCYYYISLESHAKLYLPLLDSSFHSTILSTTSRTVLTQTFTNPSSTDSIKQCTYIFPLYDGVSVVKFTCRIGDRILQGLVKEKKQAKQIYDQAVARGETAGLFEQSPKASDVFSTKLGNIPAGESVIVEITYVGELRHDAETDGIRFTIPTKIAPRYGFGDSPSPASGVAVNNGGVKITVDAIMASGDFIQSIQSPSHPIAVAMGTISKRPNDEPSMTRASATLALQDKYLDTDFVLVVKAKDTATPKAVLETHATIPNHRALMVTLVPKFALPPSRPEIVFVADRSGSMAGSKMPTLIAALKVFLKSLPVGVKFNICSFGSNHSFLWPKSMSYNQETLAQATAHLDTFGANMGGTETFAAIKATIDRRYKDIPLEVMLLTDGDIWQQEHLFTYLNEQVAKSKGAIRVFPLGIGNAVSHALIEGVARSGNGFAQIVKDGERLDNRVVRMLRGALSPHISDYTLEVKYSQDRTDDEDFELVDKVVDGMKVLLSDTGSSDTPETKSQKPISLFDPTSDPEKMDVSIASLPAVPFPKLLQAPHSIPTLFSFSRTVVYLLMSPETIQKNPTSVVLKATSPHGPLELEIPIEVLAEPAETLHQLAARKAVQDFEEGRGWLYDAKDGKGMLVKDRFPSTFDDLIEREAVRLGTQFQVAGKWCSFVAVAANDKEIAARKENPEAYEQERDEIFEDKSELSDASSPPEPSFGMALNVSSCFRSLVFRDAGSGGQEKYKSPGASGFSGELVTRGESGSGGGSGFRGGSALLKRIGTVNTPGQPQAMSSRSSSSMLQQAAPMASGFYGGHQQQLAMPAPSPSFASTSSQMDQAPKPSFPDSLGRKLSKPATQASSPGPLGRPLHQTDRKSSSEQSAPTNRNQSTASDKIHLVISLQAFEGSWAVSTDLKNCLGLAADDFQPPMKMDVKAWMTLLVVCWFEQKNQTEEGVWGLVVEKAREWLAAELGLGLEKAEAAAKDKVMGL